MQGKMGVYVAAGLVAALVWLGLAAAARGQSTGVELQVRADDVGLGGLVRPGGWTPLLVTLENRSSEPRQVRCEWIVPDIDGDLVRAQRTVTLSPQRSQQAWLYAAVSTATSPASTWRVRVVDERSGRLLSTQQVSPGQSHLASMTARVIGLTGSASLGLEPYDKEYTQHERAMLLLGLQGSKLPDRWYGLSMLQALVWTPSGGDPGAADVSSEVHQAVRQWVQRGGHLVVVLPSAGSEWFDSPLKDLLPPVAATTVTDVPLPVWVGQPEPVSAQAKDRFRVTLRRLSPRGDVSVLLRDHDEEPVVVAWRYGLGRVTMIGLDLSDPRLVREGLPWGPMLWNAVFGWRSPVFTQAYIDSQLAEDKLSNPTLRPHFELGQFVAVLIAMRETAAPALLAAVLMFVVYWLAAGPIGFAVLQKKGKVRHAWTVFALVVVTFTVVSWGGAWMARPSDQAIAHFSVVDIDGRTGLAHAHSWMSLFVPTHGRVEVALGSTEETSRDVLSASGLLRPRAEQSSFLDPQSYAIDGSQPSRCAIPMRSTVKVIEADTLGLTVGDAALAGDPWIVPTGKLRLENNWPTGVLRHDLPGALRDVLVVYCPGDGQEPWVWRHGSWPARQEMKLGKVQGQRLAVAPPRDDQPWKGHLGDLTTLKTAQKWADGEKPVVTVAADEVVRAVEMLTFYSVLPPPAYRRTDFTNPPEMYDRSLGRALDLSALLAVRCVIVIGHLHESPLPLSLTADGQTIAAKGWTVLRWISPIEEESNEARP